MQISFEDARALYQESRIIRAVLTHGLTDEFDEWEDYRSLIFIGDHPDLGCVVISHGSHVTIIADFYPASMVEADFYPAFMVEKDPAVKEAIFDGLKAHIRLGSEVMKFAVEKAKAAGVFEEVNLNSKLSGVPIMPKAA